MQRIYDRLSVLKKKIIIALLSHRSMTAKQCAALIYEGGIYNESQEKTIYNYLRELSKLKLVDSYKKKESKGAIFYLSKKGYELALDMLDVEIGHYGEGWISEGEVIDCGDISYEIYSPPEKQINHTLLLNEFFIRLQSIPKDIIKYRTNLYSSVNYWIDEDKFRFRPDAEICLIQEGINICIEIDYATESHEQLCEKFQTYRRYYDYCESNNINIEHTGILFVVPDRNKYNGIKRRWANVVTAFLKEMGPYAEKINLIMTPLHRVKETLHFELNRSNHEIKVYNVIKSILKNMAYDQVENYVFTDTNDLAYSQGIKNSSYDVIFSAISQQFETAVYTRVQNFVNNLFEHAKKGKYVDELNFRDLKKCIFYAGNPPILIKNSDRYALDETLKKYFQMFNENTHFINLSELTGATKVEE